MKTIGLLGEMKGALILFIPLFLLLYSCTHKYSIVVLPADGQVLINGQSYVPGEVFQTKDDSIQVHIEREGYEPLDAVLEGESHKDLLAVSYQMEPITFPVEIDLLEENTVFQVDGVSHITGQLNEALSWGDHRISLISDDLGTFSFPLVVKEPIDITIRHPGEQPENLPVLSPMGIYRCGNSPKQVNITPDGRYIYIALLDGMGFQIFDTQSMEMVNFVHPGDALAQEKGFVEGLFIPEYNSYFVSQMSTGNIYEYDVSDYADPQYRRTIDIEGRWPKVIAYCPELDVIAVSNWSSSDVSLVHYETGEVFRKLSEPYQPRGLQFSPEGDYLYVAAYEGGTVYKYSTEDWTIEAQIALTGSYMRHIRMADQGQTLYVSDMGLARIHEIDSQSFRIIRSYSVDVKPNSIDLTPDEDYLVISTRGPNNPQSYLLRSLEPGRVNILDLEKGELVSRLIAGTQPTGLDVSPDGSFFVVSNFQDHNIEIYRF